MRRPPPTPTHLRLLRGNPGKRPIRSEPEPQIPESIPEPPAFLTGHAADEWRRVAPELYRLRLLTLLDVGPFAAYCQSYARWRTAEEVLADMATRDPRTSGLLIKRSDGNEGANPMVRIAANAAAAMISYAGHFGMSPAARARIAAGIGHEPQGGSKFDGLMVR